MPRWQRYTRPCRAARPCAPSPAGREAGGVSVGGCAAVGRRGLRGGQENGSWARGASQWGRTAPRGWVHGARLE
eukprot:2640566-Prymnesium_polylepis.2